MPEVSVIIPNYNHSRFLVQRIESVLNQTYRDFELIILDDCSTDNSKDIIENYRNHTKISHIVFNTNNSGSTFKQWKRGIELSRGKYIWIAESDDDANPKLLETLINPFFIYPDLILSYCQSTVIDEKNNHVSIYDWADALDNKKWKSDYIESSQVEVNKYLKYRNTIPNASAVLFKKPDLNIFDEVIEMRFLGDWLLWKKLLNVKGKIVFFHQTYNFFRIHKQSTKHKSTAEKEKQRYKEINLFVDKNFDLSDNKYDWMIHGWFMHREVFKNTIYYYSTFFSIKMKIRTFFLQLKYLLKS